MAGNSRARTGALIGGALLLAPLAAAGGWIAYSRLAVDHNVPLPNAVEARRGTVGTSVGRLSYYVDDSAGGRPLVLIHSINAGASAYEMRPLFEHYRGQRTGYALELPGFGFSDRPAVEYTPDMYRRAIREFFEKVLDQPADGVVLPLSGEFVALAAVEQPERFNSLTLISPTGSSAPGEDSETNRSRSPEMSDRLLRLFRFPFGGRAFFDLIASTPSIRYFLDMSFVGSPDEGLVQYAYQSSHQPGAHHAPLYFITGRLFSEGIREQVYARLPMPVLVIYDEDPFTGFEELQPFAVEHPNWTLARIQPTRGLPHFEQLGQTTDALDTFWQGV